MGRKIRFELKSLIEKPYRFKKSKYDQIIDQFLNSDMKIASVEVEGKNSSYIRTILAKRIKLRGLKDKLKAYTIEGVLYLEKTIR
jgi:hypothetical protein